MKDLKKSVKKDSKTVITICPSCGCEITEANDAGNGFCLDCVKKEK